MHPQSTAQQPNTDDQQRWYFTFGAGHEHDGRYVEIAGRYDEARAEMIRHFGTAWCAQYAAWEPSKLSGFPQGLVELLPKEEWPPTSAQPELDPRQRLAAELHRIAADIVEHNLPVPTFSLRVGGCVESRADAQAWADFLGVEIKMGGSASNIPVAEKDIKLGDGQYLNLAFQAPSEERPTDPEKQRLLERVAELEARIAEGGADR